MVNPELERLEIEMKQLEIRKIQAEIHNEKFYPVRRISLLQAILPAFLTLMSIFLTLLYLNSHNAFNFKFDELSAKRENLIHDINKIGDSTEALNLKNAALLLNINQLKTDSSLLKYQVSVLNKVKNKDELSLSARQKENYNLTIANKILSDRNDSFKLVNKLQFEKYDNDVVHVQSKAVGLENAMYSKAMEINSLKEKINKFYDQFQMFKIDFAGKNGDTVSWNSVSRNLNILADFSKNVY